MIKINEASIMINMSSRYTTPNENHQISNQGVLSAAATGLSDFILKQGADVEHVFHISDINTQLLESPTLSLQLPNYCQVLENAATLSGCDNFGLYYGQQFQPKALGLIGYIALCSPTLEHALKNMASHFHLHQKDTFTRLIETPDHWRLDYQIQHGAILTRRQDSELTMGMFMNIIRSVLGQNYAPRAIHFEHTRPTDYQEHRKVFNAPVYFDQPYNSILLAKTDMQTAMPDQDPILLTVIQDTLRLLNTQSHQQKFIDQVRSLIHLSFNHGEPNLECIAHQLNMSNTCLTRKLKSQGTTFSTLVDHVRCEIAEYYMKQQLISISEMAFLLGYSEVSAFSRAFKRWFGITPRQWRH